MCVCVCVYVRVLVKERERDSVCERQTERVREERVYVCMKECAYVSMLVRIPISCV